MTPDEAASSLARSGVPEPRQTLTRVGEYVIHAAEFGASGEPLVLVHGLGGSSRWWYRNVPELAERYRVMIPDLIGFGRSRRPQLRLPTLDAVAEVLIRWLDQREIERANLVGHSMGGQMSIHLAVRFPDRLDRLVLVDSAGIPRPISPRHLLRFAMEVAPLWRWGDPRFLPVIARDALSAGPWTIMQALSYIVRDDVRPLLPRVAAPTLIIWGERDGLVPLEHGWELRGGIPGSRIAVLRGASHNPMVDRPADFNRLLLRFLDGESVGR